jgi:DNA-binding transcriptional LysR family regulator
MNPRHDHPPELARLGALDLNALLALDAMLQARGVSAAGRALGASQSALSHTLRRARGWLDDPLLLREGDGMALTPRAEALREPLRAALLALGRALDPPRFDPATDARRFRVAAPDLFSLLVLPALVRVLLTEAPAVQLISLPFGGGAAPGEVDLEVVPDAPWSAEPPRPTELLQRSLLDSEVVVFSRDPAPPWTVEAYAARPHLLVAPEGGGPTPVDAALAARGLRRPIAVQVSGFAEAAALVASTPLLLTAPRAFGRLLTGAGVSAQPVPLPLPRQGLLLRWPARLDADPAHRWLRRRLVAVVGSLQLG